MFSGGFSCCFSSKDVCRFCHCMHSDLISHIHDYDGDKMHDYWTSGQYDEICDRIEQAEEEDEEKDEEPGLIDTLYQEHVNAADEEVQTEERECAEEYEDLEEGKLSEEFVDEESDDQESSDESYADESNIGEENNHGLKHRCPLNQLKSFHSTLSLPPDSMHDALEGVAAQDLCAGIKILSLKGWFSIEEYNRKLKGLGYSSYESSDVPEAVAKKARKLSGKACSIWVHVRNFPLVVKGFLYDNDALEVGDKVLVWILKLVEVINRLSATEFRNNEIELLDTKIVEYLDARKEIYEQFPEVVGTPKPKHHLLTHYAQAVRLFGPPLGYWTGRFER